MHSEQRPRAPVFGRRRFLAMAAAGAAGAHLAGCGVAGGDAAQAEGKLRAAFGQPVTDLDPFSADAAVDEATLIVKRLLFDTLVRREGEELVPGIAESWEQSDESTWVFQLRRGVTFHDGRELTAADVVASLERMQAVPSAQTPLWEPVTSVAADDDYTVRFGTDGPFGTLPVNLTLLFIVPADLVDDPDLSREPVGSGPFKMREFTPSADVELDRFDDYWDQTASSRGVSMPYIAEVSSAITALRNDEVDLLWPIPPDQLAEVENVPGVVVEPVPSWTYYFTWFNCGREPFTDPRVRRAMWQAVDIATIVEELFGEGAAVMEAPIPSTVFGFSPQEPHEYAPDAARKALSSLGLDGGFTTTMMWFDATGPLARELAQAMISSWAEIGVTVRPQSIEKAEWLERLNTLDWDMELQTNTVTTGDADFTLGRLYTSEANRMGYSNPELDTVLAEAGRTSSTARREELYAQACKTIWDDAVGIFPAGITTSYGRREELSGFVPAPSNQPDLWRVQRR